MHRMQCARDGRGQRLQIPLGGRPRRFRLRRTSTKESCGESCVGSGGTCGWVQADGSNDRALVHPLRFESVPVPEPSRLYISSSRSSSPPNTAPDYTSHHRDRPRRPTRRPIIHLIIETVLTAQHGARLYISSSRPSSPPNTAPMPPPSAIACKAEGEASSDPQDRSL